MVFESQDPQRQPYYSQLERQSFAKDRSLESLSNIHIWLAPFPDAPVGAAFLMKRYSTPAQDSGLQIITCQVGQIAIQFLAWKRLRTFVNPTNLDAAPIDFGKLATSEWPKVTVQIWPRPAWMRLWPPYRYLSAKGFESLTKRFGY